jgi:energy-coupling factor transporter transmembrane protein EcfT
MVAPAATLPGVAVAMGTTLSWVIACRPPLQVARSFTLLGLVLFLPYFLLVPLIQVAGPGHGAAWWHPFISPWGVLLHGMTGMLISVSTATTLSPSDLRRGMLSLPVPRLVSAILLQIIHQTSELVYETKRMAAAISVRGASSGWRTSISVLSSIPRVWFPRLLVRADRVAAAMEVRGYCEVDQAVLVRPSTTHADAVALTMAAGVLALAIVLRLGGNG